ncbi:NUDIX hydrolase [Prosthecomicrobium hirschii]|uniref:NUDIX hydrolase n=1 Tax=Prosthecodimorpha hirschii TaxID=665126 RepID=UPI00221FD4EA|nr:NUDIX domain-containing protein [Prosthecomicrobium hirschii]MCW1843597.1 NUDIX domain-containing protein [Prosthecomicrobium hirschii]
MSESTTDILAQLGRPLLGVSVSVWRGDRVLLIRRGRDPGRGLWAPVGGKVALGERLAEAALREVREETGVECRLTPLSDLREMIMPARDGRPASHVVLAVYGADWISGEPVAGDDAEAAAWFAPADFDGLAMVPGTVPYILATRRLIGGGAP